MSKGASRVKGTEGDTGGGSLVVEGLVRGWMRWEALGTRTGLSSHPGSGREKGIWSEARSSSWNVDGIRSYVFLMTVGTS